MNKTFMIKAGAVAAICIILSLIYVWSSLHSSRMIQGHDVTIAQGSSGTAIANTLQRESIIHSSFLFRWFSRLTGASAQLKPGLYHFEGDLSMVEVLEMLRKGEVQQFKVTIPEGLRTDEMLTLLAERTGTALEVWQQALTEITQDKEFEGLFLPETYLYTKPINARALLQQMYDARANVEAAIAKELNWSEEQIKRNRIMASIVEKETALPHERVWVSAAIHNRIRLGMPLQMDPTVIYGIYRTQGSFSGNIRHKDLRADTPWNTYTRRGLPITPISNPGAESLRAAAYPADVKYLYFVADGTGGHAFASTLEEHNRNVQKWIQIEKQKP